MISSKVKKINYTTHFIIIFISYRNEEVSTQSKKEIKNVKVLAPLAAEARKVRTTNPEKEIKIKI